MSDFYITPSGRKVVKGPSSPPETAVLFGTGAIANSWRPVAKALKRLYPHVPHGEENLAFATVVSDLRHRAYIARRSRVSLFGFSASNVSKQLGTMWKAYERLVADIAEELSIAMADKEIWAQPFVHTLRDRLTNIGKYVVLTTNWDFCLEDVFTDEYVAHIHGNIKEKGSLYLPSEMGWEPYRHERTRRFYVGEKVKPWQIWNMRFGSYPAHWSTLSHANWLVHKTKRLIVAGLSFSHLDPELGMLIGSIVNPGSRIQELVVIDLDPQPIVNRILFHAHGRIDNIQLLKPDEVGALVV